VDNPSTEPPTEPRRRKTMGLRDKYGGAIQTAKSLYFDGSAEERDEKLYFKGTVQSQEQANKIWDAIKLVPDWSKDVVADIQVKPRTHRASVGAQSTSTMSPSERTYTVKLGETLNKIAEDLLGHASAYELIFAANRDQLSEPNQIQPGQVLKIPTLRR
jgi:nucleoid-associated protein YgaU